MKDDKYKCKNCNLGFYSQDDYLGHIKQCIFTDRKKPKIINDRSRESFLNKKIESLENENSQLKEFLSEIGEKLRIEKKEHKSTKKNIKRMRVEFETQLEVEREKVKKEFQKKQNRLQDDYKTKEYTSDNPAFKALNKDLYQKIQSIEYQLKEEKEKNFNINDKLFQNNKYVKSIITEKEELSKKYDKLVIECRDIKDEAAAKLKKLSSTIKNSNVSKSISESNISAIKNISQQVVSEIKSKTKEDNPVINNNKTANQILVLNTTVSKYKNVVNNYQVIVRFLNNNLDKLKQRITNNSGYHQLLIDVNNYIKDCTIQIQKSKNVHESINLIDDPKSREISDLKSLNSKLEFIHTKSVSEISNEFEIQKNNMEMQVESCKLEIERLKEELVINQKEKNDEIFKLNNQHISEIENLTLEFNEKIKNNTEEFNLKISNITNEMEKHKERNEKRIRKKFQKEYSSLMEIKNEIESNEIYNKFLKISSTFKVLKESYQIKITNLQTQLETEMSKDNFEKIKLLKSEVKTYKDSSENYKNSIEEYIRLNKSLKDKVALLKNKIKSIENVEKNQTTVTSSRKQETSNKKQKQEFTGKMKALSSKYEKIIEKLKDKIQEFSTITNDNKLVIVSKNNEITKIRDELNTIMKEKTILESKFNELENKYKENIRQTKSLTIRLNNTDVKLKNAEAEIEELKVEDHEILKQKMRTMKKKCEDEVAELHKNFQMERNHISKTLLTNTNLESLTGNMKNLPKNDLISKYTTLYHKSEKISKEFKLKIQILYKQISQLEKDNEFEKQRLERRVEEIQKNYLQDLNEFRHNSQVQLQNMKSQINNEPLMKKIKQDYQKKIDTQNLKINSYLSEVNILYELASKYISLLSDIELKNSNLRSSIKFSSNLIKKTVFKSKDEELINKIMGKCYVNENKFNVPIKVQEHNQINKIKFNNMVEKEKEKEKDPAPAVVDNKEQQLEKHKLLEQSQEQNKEELMKHKLQKLSSLKPESPKK